MKKALKIATPPGAEMSNSPSVKTCPIYETMSRKLLGLGYDSMSILEKSKMMIRAIKAAKESVAPTVIELERELADKNALIEQMKEALKLALPEARSTYVEQAIIKALKMERGEKI